MIRDHDPTYSIAYGNGHLISRYFPLFARLLSSTLKNSPHPVLKGFADGVTKYQDDKTKKNREALQELRQKQKEREIGQELKR